MDPRLTQLADIIIGYSVALKPGEKILIDWAGHAAEDLVHALVRRAAQAGGVPVWQQMEASLVRQLVLNGSEEQLRDFGQVHRAHMAQFQAYVAVRGSDNIFEMNDIPPERRKWYTQHFTQPVHMEQRLKHTKWCVLRYPNASMAQLAETSTDAFKDFYFKATLLDYKKFAAAMQPLKELMARTDRIHIVAPGTDLKFSIKNIPVVPCVGDYNIPDGEVFTAPVRDSINGTIQFNTPSPYMGSLFHNIQLTFRDGKIVEADCEGDRDALTRILDTDAGARYVGEFAVAFHPWIRTPMKDILFDEKIAGSLHMALGNAYDMAFNGNRSGVHWDLVLIQRKEYGGGELFFDNRLIRKDGVFVAPELCGLNPEAWGAPPC